MYKTLIDEVNEMMDDCNYHGLRRSIEGPIWLVIAWFVTITARVCGFINGVIEAIRSSRDP